MAAAWIAASPVHAQFESVTVPANSVSTSTFSICEPAARLVVIPTGWAKLDYAVWDEGQNLVLFDAGDDVMLRQQIAKIEALDCEQFTLAVFNRGEEDVSVDVHIRSARVRGATVRGEKGQRSGDGLAMNPTARIPRCPSSDTRCEAGKKQ